MWSICIHGGAGNISREREVRADVSEMRAALHKAIAVVKQEQAGLLRKTSPNAPTALAAAVEAVITMEDSIFFNAGRGSCLNRAGKCEMEAAVMVGKSLSSGACCGVTRVKNPILLAEHVRVNTPHTFVGFEAVETLAEEAGLDMKDPKYFVIDRRTRQQVRAQKAATIIRDHDLDLETPATSGDTVGAVVLDMDGCLAGAVSTGGVTNKYAGRIGDSPCIGSGLYVTPFAAVCGTGFGESFVASNFCAQICHAMKYGNLSLGAAIERVLEEDMPDDAGGVIALDANGVVEMRLKCQGMFRASADSTGKETVAVWD